MAVVLPKDTEQQSYVRALYCINFNNNWFDRNGNLEFYSKTNYDIVVQSINITCYRKNSS